MVTYPIRCRHEGYRGADPKKRRKAAELNRIATELEQYINKQLQEQQHPIHVYLYYQIASATGYTEEQVRHACYVIDGGSNGFTAIKPGMTLDQAMDANHKAP